MNDEARFTLELYFDGELASDRQTDVARLLAEDPEARRYLDRLARLRSLARSLPASRELQRTSAGRRSVGLWAVATAAVAASVATVLVWHRQSAPSGPGDWNAVSVAGAPDGAKHVEISNPPGRGRVRQEPAAKTILLSRTRLGKRLAAVEILALNLANVTPELAGDLESLALVHKPAPGGRTRVERHGRRARSATPRA